MTVSTRSAFVFSRDLDVFRIIPQSVASVGSETVNIINLTGIQKDANSLGELRPSEGYWEQCLGIGRLLRLLSILYRSASIRSACLLPENLTWAAFPSGAVSCTGKREYWESASANASNGKIRSKLAEFIDSPRTINWKLYAVHRFLPCGFHVDFSVVPNRDNNEQKHTTESCGVPVAFSLFTLEAPAYLLWIAREVLLNDRCNHSAHYRTRENDVDSRDKKHGRKIERTGFD